MAKTKQQIRVLMADDHAIFRDGLRKLLDGDEEMVIVGEAQNGNECIKLLAKLKPDILLLDLAMPRHPGLEALRDLGSGQHSVRVILLTAAAEKQQIVEALQLGARVALQMVLREAMQLSVQGRKQPLLGARRTCLGVGYVRQQRTDAHQSKVYAGIILGACHV